MQNVVKVTDKLQYEGYLQTFEKIKLPKQVIFRSKRDLRRLKQNSRLLGRKYNVTRWFFLNKTI